MQPLIYSAQAALDGVGWRRGGREVTYFENGVTRRDREKGSHSTMSFVWTCEHDSDLLYFAMCYPYTFSKLRRCGAPPRALSAQLPGTGDPYSRARALPPAPRQLPRLAGRRPVARAARPARAAVHHARGERVRLSLGDRSRGDGRADWRAAGRLRLCARPSRREQRVVDDARCAATRPHRRRPAAPARPTLPRPPARPTACTASSATAPGILEFLTGDSAEAYALRRELLFLVVPMLNPDGVVLGNYRCSLAAVDLNRRWAKPSARHHPTIYALKKLLIATHSRQQAPPARVARRASRPRPAPSHPCAPRHRRLRPSLQVAMYVDLHGHSRKQAAFMYGCAEKGSGLLQQIFPLLLSKVGPPHARSPAAPPGRALTRFARASAAGRARLLLPLVLVRDQEGEGEHGTRGRPPRARDPHLVHARSVLLRRGDARGRDDADDLLPLQHLASHAHRRLVLLGARALLWAPGTRAAHALGVTAAHTWQSRTHRSAACLGGRRRRGRSDRAQPSRHYGRLRGAKRQRRHRFNRRRKQRGRGRASRGSGGASGAGGAAGWRTHRRLGRRHRRVGRWRPVG